MTTPPTRLEPPTTADLVARARRHAATYHGAGPDLLDALATALEDEAARLARAQMTIREMRGAAVRIGGILDSLARARLENP